jgi:hypothetical protein
MITQILGVALISLLTITPTIQQNNIEQLKAPNIEIQDQLTTITGYENRIWFPQPATIYNFTARSTYTRLASVGANTSLILSTVQQTGKFLAITDDNFYFHWSDNNFDLQGETLRLLIRDYYTFSRGTTVSSETFGFTVSSSTIPRPTQYYTYTVSNTSTGSMTGRIYIVQQVDIDSAGFPSTNFGTTQNFLVGSNFQTVINQVINNVTLENDDFRNNKVLYYWTNSSPNFNQTSTNQSMSIHLRTTFGYSHTLGSFTYNVISDTTPPTITSITGNPVNWTNQDVTLTVQASDNNSLNTNAYSFDNGVTYQASNSKTFTTNEIVNIKVRDSSNNETSQQVIINRIDKQSPAINLAGNWKNTFELGELTSNNDLYNYLSISDGASGINSLLTTISNFNYNQAGTYTNVQVSATDNAGNTNNYTAPTITITEPLDTSPPTISGVTSITRQQGNITTQDILSNFTISDPSGIEETRIQRLDNTIVTSWDDFTTGTYQLRVYARDTVGNIALYQFELIVTEPPIPDTTPPVITGSLLTSFEIGTYTSTSEILALYTITDNVAVGVSQVIGTIDFEELGDYPVTISATDTSNNTTTKDIVVRIRADVVLGNYNPLTDLLSGIFGGLLSMIFTIGTINVLGLRLLDAMGVIILGAVLLFVYKAIKGGS